MLIPYSARKKSGTLGKRSRRCPAEYVDRLFPFSFRTMSQVQYDGRRVYKEIVYKADKFMREKAIVFPKRIIAENVAIS